ncbi:hypothetical protein A0256_13970 [Mucilaginibacter sp. PAMC 26640]|nr:hypothetical protein A0256_13970 [Mucilaginibacter sp. PAMC 26640]
MTSIKKKGNIAVGEQIAVLRIERKMNQATLAEIIGVSVYAMSNIETGKTGTNSAVLVKIAAALDVSLSYLLSFKDNVPTGGLQDSLAIARNQLEEQDLLIVELRRKIISLYEKLYQQ